MIKASLNFMLWVPDIADDKHPSQTHSMEHYRIMKKLIVVMLIRVATVTTVFLVQCGCKPSFDNKEAQRPNIILCMADDMGWGDVGYNGNSIVKTPHLDEMSSQGIQFNRFYASSPVCSPTRGSCITGRFPYRYGITFANTGHLKKEEVSLAEVLKLHGYTTGHFGKWHLGSLTTTEEDSNRGGPKYKEHYSIPHENGFDVCFSTESKVPTYDPMITPIGWRGNEETDKPFGTAYWDENGEKITNNLSGDDSRVIMDRAIPFIENAAKEKKPFFTVIWFHAPHLPIVAGDEHRKYYTDLTKNEQHYFGCITALDEQMGRLRQKLDELGISENTMLWFTSDNGPEGGSLSPESPGSAGPYKGRKRSLHEGGVRVPGLLVWPHAVKKPFSTGIPASTLDYFPTVLDVLGYKLPDNRPIDGVSLKPLINGKMKQRSMPIGFESGIQQAFMNNQYKIYSSDEGKSFELFDITTDSAESKNIIDQFPDVANDLIQQLHEWRASCSNSNEGMDYVKH